MSCVLSGWVNEWSWSVSHQSDMIEATISNNSNCRLKRWIMCVNPSLFLYKHWERYSCGYLILIFPMLSSLWLRSGLCRWISKQFRSRIFNQPKIYSLLPTITCHQGFAFFPLSLLVLFEVHCKSCKYCNLTSVNN